VKKKLTVNTLAFGNLKRRHRQYTIMIIGIILAMVFSSSIVLMMSSYYSSLYQFNDEAYGKQDVIWTDVNNNDLEACKEQKFIGKNGYAHIIGYGFTDEKQDYNGVSIGWYDETAKELSYPVLLEGDYPSAENEIAVESIMLSKMGIDAAVGDEITLKVRVQNGSETFEEYKEKTYKLVGILKNRVNNYTFSSGVESKSLVTAVVSQDTKIDAGGKEKLNLLFDFPKDNQSTRKAFQKFYNDKGLYEKIVNITDTEIFYTNDSTGYDMLLEIVFISIIVAVLMLASCLSIINAFNSNLKDRRKQIGLLRAVGATRRQIIKIFGREAFIISLICTPLSVLISFFIVKGVITLLGDGYIFIPNWWMLVICIVINIITVMLAALIPLVNASKITPIQSIRNIEDNRKMKNKHIKSKKEFNVPNLIAKRTMTFSKGRQIAVSIILIVSIIASGYVVSWYSSEKNNIYDIQSDYTMHLSAYGSSYVGVNFKTNNVGFTENDKQTVENSPFIADGYGRKEAYANLLIPFDTSDYRKELSDKYVRSYLENCNSSEEQLELEKNINADNYEEMLFSKIQSSFDIDELSAVLQTNEHMTTDFLAYNSSYIEQLDKNVYDGKINIDNLNSGKEVILVAPKKLGVYFMGGKYGGLQTVYNENVDKHDCIFTDECDFKAGDEIEFAILDGGNENDMSEESGIPKDTKVTWHKVKIAAIVTDTEYPGNLSILTTTTGLNHFIKDIKYKELYFTANQKITDENDKAVMEIMNSISTNVEQGVSSSNYQYHKDQRETAQRMLIAALSVIILMMTISLSIINNSITANIRNSKIKIGTLRAVGASQRDLVKSYIHQLMSMMLWGIGIGFAGFFISFLGIYLFDKYKNIEMNMVCNPLASIIFCIIVFAVCSINLWINVRREMKNSIVENIREL